MSFLSFNEKYFTERTSFFENRILLPQEIYEVKQLLKILDDLSDEGYTKLNTHLENNFKIVSRLQKIISNNKEYPFPKSNVVVSSTNYSYEEMELDKFTHRITDIANKHQSISTNPMLRDIVHYCEWIGYEGDTAYIFLFRDAFLPFVYYMSRGRSNLYSWLIGRTFLAKTTGRKNFDDMIRIFIYDSLEKDITDYEDFRKFCFGRINKLLNDYSELKNILIKLLQSITLEKIIVIETGYCGTIPLLLTALDERVDFRLFTSAPYLYKTYKRKIYTKQYEKMRLFETLYSQDSLMKFSSFHNDRFWVNETTNSEVLLMALSEIKAILNQ